MDLTYPPEAEQFRKEVRAWLEQNLPDGWFDPDFTLEGEAKVQFQKEWTEKLFEGGWICASWPKEYGGKGLTTMESVVAAEEFEDEHELMGATSYGVGLGDWVVRRPEHWLFEGTGLTAGDAIPSLVGWEYQGPPLRADPSLVVLASGPVFDRRGQQQAPDFAATLYDGPRDNVVFNAATCWWSMLLSTPPGFVSPPGEDFARSDPRVQRITENLLARMLRRGSPGQ